MKPTAILLAGPAGSGKSTTAARVGQHPRWAHMSEDEWWVKIETADLGESFGRTRNRTSCTDK